jgi:hypothetical protein
MIFLFTHFFLLKQPNLSLHIMYSLHAAFPSGKCKIKEGRSHIAIFWAEFHPKYSTIGVLSGPHEMLIYICLYSIKNFAVIDLNFWRLQKYVPCGPSMTPESTVEVSGRFPEVSGGFRTIRHWQTTRYLYFKIEIKTLSLHKIKFNKRTVTLVKNTVRLIGNIE